MLAKGNQLLVCSRKSAIIELLYTYLLFTQLEVDFILYMSCLGNFSESSRFSF